MEMNEKFEPEDTFTKAHFDFDQLPYLSNPWRKLNLHSVSLGLIKLPPSEGYTFTHHHVKQEEIYIVVEGKGQILLNGELINIERGDIVRVSPPTKRALKASSKTSLFVICTGGVTEGYPESKNARYLIDDGVPSYDDVPPWYEGNPDIIKRNDALKARMQKSEKNRENN